MAFGINLGLVLVCSLFAEHLSYTWAPHDAQRVRGYGSSGSSRMAVEQRQTGGSYPQDQFRPASSTSGSVWSEDAHRGTGPNTLRGVAPSASQPGPRGSGSTPSSRFTSAQTRGKRTRSKNTDIRLSGFIASGTSVGQNKHHTMASRTSGQNVTNPSAVKPVSSWEAKRIQPNTIHSVQPHSSSSGLVQNPPVSNLKLSTPNNYGSTQSGTRFSTSRQPNQGLVQTQSRGAPSLYVQAATHSTFLTRYVQDLTQGSSSSTLASKGPIEISAQSISTRDREVPASGSSQTKFMRFGSTQGGSATKSYKPSFSQDVMQYQSRSDSRSGLTSNQYAQTSGQSDGASTSSSGIPTPSLASRTSLFYPSSTRSGNSYGTYKPGSTLSATPSQSLLPSNQGGRGSTYSQNVLATPAQRKYGQMSAQRSSYQPSYTASSGPIASLFNAASSSTYSQNVLATPAQRKYGQMSAQRRSYQPSYTASSGPIASLFNAASSSTFIQNAPATAQKPSSFAWGQDYSYQPSYTPNAVKSNPSSARGPTQSRTSSGISTTPQRFAPTIIHNIPEWYGGSPIQRLKDPAQ